MTAIKTSSMFQDDSLANVKHCMYDTENDKETTDFHWGNICLHTMQRITDRDNLGH